MFLPLLNEMSKKEQEIDVETINTVVLELWKGVERWTLAHETFPHLCTMKYGWRNEKRQWKVLILWYNIHCILCFPSMSGERHYLLWKMKWKTEKLSSRKHTSENPNSFYKSLLKLGPWKHSWKQEPFKTMKTPLKTTKTRPSYNFENLPWKPQQFAQEPDRQMGKGWISILFNYLCDKISLALCVKVKWRWSWSRDRNKWCWSF